MSEILVDGIPVFQNPDAVLFDKDGTLIDIHHYWSSMIRIRSSFITNRYFPGHREQKNIENSLIDAMGVDITNNRMKPEGPVGIKPRPYIVNIASDLVRLKGKKIVNEDMEDLFSEVDKKTTEDMAPLLRLLPGVVKLLERLDECGIASAIVSTDITSRARLAMETLELDHYFDEIIGGDRVKSTKPSPDLALDAIDRCNSNANKAIVIGDHPVDIEMGKSAGTGLNIGVLTGLSTADTFDGMDCVVIQNLNCIEVRC